MTYSGINVNMFSNGNNMLNQTLNFTGFNSSNYFNIGNMLTGNMYSGNMFAGDDAGVAQAGVGIGLTMFQYMMQGLHSRRSEKASASEPQQTEDLSASLKEVNTKITANLEKLGIEDEESVADAKVDDYPAYKTAGNKINELSSKIEPVQAEVNGYQKAMKTLKDELGDVKFYRPTTEQEKELKKQYEDAETKCKAKKEELAKLQAQKEEAEAAQTKAKAEFEKLQKETIELLDKKAEIKRKQDSAAAAVQKEKDNKVLDDADKRRFKRLSYKKYDALFDENGKLNDNNDASCRAARTAVHKFFEAKTPEEKLKAGQQFQEIAKELSTTEIKDEGLGGAQNIINKYVKEKTEQ